jgi:hypothetical protein
LPPLADPLFVVAMRHSMPICLWHVFDAMHTIIIP